MHRRIVLQILQNSELSDRLLILHYYIFYIIHKKYVCLQLYEYFQFDRIFQFFHCYQFFYLSQAKFPGLEYLVQNLLFVLHNIFCFYQDLLVQKRGFRSKSSKFGDPLLTCLKRSVLPIISFKDLNPSSDRISLTS